MSRVAATLRDALLVERRECGLQLLELLGAGRLPCLDADVLDLGCVLGVGLGQHLDVGLDLVGNLGCELLEGVGLVRGSARARERLAETRCGGDQRKAVLVREHARKVRRGPVGRRLFGGRLFGRRLRRGHRRTPSSSPPPQPTATTDMATTAAKMPSQRTGRAYQRVRRDARGSAVAETSLRQRPRGQPPGCRSSRTRPGRPRPPRAPRPGARARAALVADGHGHLRHHRELDGLDR